MNNLTEEYDAQQVDHAIQLINEGNTLLAHRLLDDIVARAPENYVYEWEEAGELYVKFWGFEAFMHYVIWQKMSECQAGKIPERRSGRSTGFRTHTREPATISDA